LQRIAPHAAAPILICSPPGDILGPLGVGILNDQFNAIWGDEAIRYSMAITACFALFSGPVLLLAGRHFKADREAAGQWVPSDQRG